MNNYILRAYTGGGGAGFMALPILGPSLWSGVTSHAIKSNKKAKASTFKSNSKYRCSVNPHYSNL